MLQLSQCGAQNFGNFGRGDATDTGFKDVRRELVERYSPEFADWVAALRRHHQTMVGQDTMVGGVLPRSALGRLGRFVPSEQVMVLLLSEAFEPVLRTLMLESPEVLILDSPDGLSCDTALGWTAILDDGVAHSLCVPAHSLSTILNGGAWNDNAALFVRVILIAGGSVAFGGFRLDEFDVEDIQFATICAQSRPYIQTSEAEQGRPEVTCAPWEAVSQHSPSEKVLTLLDVYISNA